MAPAAQASRTSLIEQFSPLPMALTTSSGIGSPQATTLRPAGLPFSAVGESSGIVAKAARSLTTWMPARAMSTVPIIGVSGWASMSNVLATPSPVIPNALTVNSVKGLSTVSASQSPSSSAWRRRRFGGSLPPSVMLSITEISAMPSPMQWWMRAISALPPS